MKRTISQLLQKWNYDSEDAESTIDFVVELMEEQIRITKEEHPQATRSIYEMELALSKLKDLPELFEIDPEVQAIMDYLDIDQDGVEELMTETMLDASELNRHCREQTVSSFNSRRDAFDHAHEEYDRDELLDFLYRDESNFSDEYYFEIQNQCIYFKNGY